MILVERHWNRALGVLLAATTLLGGCGAGGGGGGGGGAQPAPGGGNAGGEPARTDAGGGGNTGGANGGAGGANGGAGGANGGAGGETGGSGGATGGGGTPGEPDCLDNDTFFVRKVWRETLRPVCSTCHSANGVASNTRMVFVPEGAPEWQLRNQQAFEGVATLQMDGVPLVLLKPSGEVAHGGGAVLTADAPGRAAFEEMIARLIDPESHACAATSATPTAWAGIESLSPAETLRKTTLFFGSRLPTEAELALVDANGLAGLEPALDAVLHEDAFYEWLRWATNDLLLTDKFLGSRRAVDAIDDDRYPEARWYLQDGVDPGTGLDAAWFRAAQTFTNDSIAREPVELVVHLLRHDRPITEMLTADYTVVNPFSARAYGLQDAVQFEDRFDPRSFVEARLPGIPHAGVLTTPIFMTRYPTTATNRNRARSRVVYNSFLATNVLELAQRPISAVSPIHNPTLNDPQCNVCHSVIDPVAGALQNWNARGGYEVLDAWYPEMVPPGFGEEMLPQEARTRGASWLAERIVADRRFDRAIVRWMFKAIVGSAVRTDPGAAPPGMEEDPAFLARVAAFEAQTDALTRLERELRANGHDLRVLIKSIVRSPWFRAERTVDPASLPPAAALPDVGVGRILSPEHLSRRIQAITGLPWRPRADAVDYLLDASQYKLLYGGLDSEDVIERTSEPNALMAAIQTRMATDMACLLVTQEFARAPELRRLFAGVEPSFRPLDPNGFEVPQARVAIRAALQRLHWALLGERLADDSPQLDQTWALFNETWTEVTAALASGELSANLQDNCRATRDYRTGVDLPQDRRITQDPNGTIRAWQAVVQALLSDFRFLHE